MFSSTGGSSSVWSNAGQPGNLGHLPPVDPHWPPSQRATTITAPSQQSCRMTRLFGGLGSFGMGGQVSSVLTHMPFRKMCVTITEPSQHFLVSLSFSRGLCGGGRKSHVSFLFSV